MSLYLVWPCLHLMFWWPLWGRGFLRGRVEGQRRCSGLQPASLQMLVSKPFKRPKNKVEIKPSGLFTASLTTHEHTHGCRCTEGRAPCPTPSTFLVDFLLKAVALLCGCASPALLPLGDFFFSGTGQCQWGGGGGGPMFLSHAPVQHQQAAFSMHGTADVCGILLPSAGQRTHRPCQVIGWEPRKEPLTDVENVKMNT